jgi:hypothetical protein
MLDGKWSAVARIYGEGQRQHEAGYGCGVIFEIEYSSEELSTASSVSVRFLATKYKNGYVFSHWQAEKRLNFHAV